jgi:hypothetical protein
VARPEVYRVRASWVPWETRNFHGLSITQSGAFFCRPCRWAHLAENSELFSGVKQATALAAITPAGTSSIFDGRE